MPEYRRFVSYFCEYVDGKKQKSAGFAKVELRNEMWRILLKLTAQIRQDASVQVCGFVRESGYLLLIPLGALRPVQEVAEEWAFRADAPIGEGTYRLEDLAGLRIESSDGRCFVTVWDDEGIELSRFVSELPGQEPVGTQEAQETTEIKAEEEAQETMEAAEMQAGEEAQETTEAAEMQAEEEAQEMTEISETLVGEEAPGTIEESLETLEISETQAGEEVEEAPGTQEENIEITEVSETQAEEEVEEAPGTIEESLETMEISETQAEEASGTPEPRWCRAKQSEAIETEPEPSNLESARVRDESEPDGAVEELFEKRTHFQPFSDGEIDRCVMLLPCDIVRLQQENWKVGRSSFLQHGFYQYRHLLLGISGNGTYILGVPGVRNPQEDYMAQMFGYKRFKVSSERGCGQVFGYWCRELQKD